MVEKNFHKNSNIPDLLFHENRLQGHCGASFRTY